MFPSGVLDLIPPYAGEESGLTLVIVITDMRHPRKQGERPPVFFQKIQITRVFVLQSRRFWEKKRSVETEVAGDKNKAFGAGVLF
jgi:hypothetical protein